MILLVPLTDLLAGQSPGGSSNSGGGGSGGSVSVGGNNGKVSSGKGGGSGGKGGDHRKGRRLRGAREGADELRRTYQPSSFWEG